MKSRLPARARAHEGGYAVLLAIFLVATMLLVAAAAAPNVLTEGRRLREQEAIWRGKQYVRAIRLYYQKNGKYPSSLEDLTKPNAAGVHFLRKAYKDPMNAADGSWRLIYVTGTGQLVGSVHYHTLQEMAVAQAFAGQLPGNAAGLASQLFGGINANQLGGTQLGAPGQTGAQPAQNGFQQNQQPGSLQAGAPPGQNSTDSMLSATQPAPLEAVDSPVFGGSVVGVASKIKQPSIAVYQGGKTYFDWEFIWNPLTEAGGAAGQQLPTGATLPGANGQTNAPGSSPTGGTAGPQMGNPFMPGQSQPQPMPGQFQPQPQPNSAPQN